MRLSDPPQLSVLLPVYNAESTIFRAIESILHQSFPHFELIIVLNGCTDRSKSIVEGIEDSRIRLFYLDQPDLVKALNFGISKSTARYIARMDADDWSHPSRLQTQVAFLDSHPDIGLVSGMVNYTGDTKANLGYSLYVDWANSIYSPESIYLSRFQECALPHPSVMFRKSVGEQYGFYRQGDFPEDFELWNRWLQSGVRMSKVQTTVVDWYDTPGRLSRNHQMYHTDNFAAVKAHFFAQWFFSKFCTPYPRIYVWGAGNSVKKKARHLLRHGLTISKYIDVKKTNSPSVIHYKALSYSQDIFVLNYVSDRKGKVEVKKHLEKIGFSEGKSFYMME